MAKNLDSDDDCGASNRNSSSDSEDSSSSDSSNSSNLNDGSDSDSDSKSGSSKKQSSSGSGSSSADASSDDENHNDTSKNLSHNSSSSSNARNNKKYWEENPSMYGVRRSSRERKPPERSSVLEQKKQRKRSDQWHSSDESESDNSDSEPYVYQQKVRKKVPLQRKKPSYESDDCEDSNRIRTSRTGGKVSYKEDSDTDSESEPDVRKVAYGVVEQDDLTQTVDKVIKHRMGKRGAVGQQTYIYEVEKKGDPNAHFDSEDTENTELQFLIKWKGWAHIHNTWESYESLKTQKVKGIKKLDNYTQREDDLAALRIRCTPEEVEYGLIQNEMEQELIFSHICAERIFAEAVENDITYYYVKWQNLPYAEATWENEQIVCERYPTQLASFKSREESPCYPKPVPVLKHRPKFQPLKMQPEYIGMDDSYVLRDYQLDGLNWLIHAWANHNSVILADEMGLGKTIQAISFLSYLFHAHCLYGPYLLVLPLSTVNAWLKEFAQWAPDMNVIVYLGDRSSRQIIHEYEWVTQGSRRIKFNAVLTTYEILLRDKDLLQDSCQWSCLIVDEAHRLKNEESQLYQALTGFKTNYRLLITGTPLQNSLKELWALLHFIMPVTFNNCEYFESHKDRENMKKGIHRLHKQLEPYILRRAKKEVETSLPAKTEQILRVDMTQLQKRYYRYILTRNYAKLKKGSLGSVSSFINIVMELKKCCNHSTLIRQEEEPQAYQQEYLQRLLRGSGKLLLLDKLLVRLHETGHRVLIFSQMVMMLDILADYMRLRRFLFQRLDGSISGELRRQALDHFNAEGSADFCFLLSTRAGGLGINLATADTVIIFDSDWNPQNDLQAQARAHRIGQKNQVNIYRLVTKNSIEETIIERAKQKMVLDHLVIQSMDTSGRTVFNKKLSSTSSNPFNKEELNAILKFGAEELFKEEVDNEEEPVCDIDEILRRAETRDEGPSSAGDDLLSAFKVASFNLEEEPQRIDPVTGEVKDWDDIIPDGVRSQIAEEERQKEIAKLCLPPRKRNTANSNEKSSPREKIRRRRGSDFSDGDSDENRPRKRGRPRMHHKETVKGFTDAEVRRFFKSFKKFSNPLRRLDTIANDAYLRDKHIEDLRCLGEIIIERCKEILRDHQMQKASSDKYNEPVNGVTRQRRDRGPSFKLSGVAINARTTLAALDELEALDYVVPHAPVERASWSLQLKKVKDPHWDLPWGLNEDSRLLRGIFEFGIGSWEQIKWDASLNLSDKILLSNDVKPQAKHLENRAQYLLKLLKKATNFNAKQRPIKIRIRRGKEVKGISKEIVDDDSSDDETTNISAVSVPKSSPKDEYIKTEVDNDGRRLREDSENIDYKREHRSKHKKTKKEKKSKAMVVEVTANGEETSPGKEVELNQYHPLWPECKEKMRPMKKPLKMLDNPKSSPTEDQLKHTRKCLLEIGDHIEKVLQQHTNHEDHSQWKMLLWQFVSKFTEFDAKKLHKLYKKHKKEKEEKKEAYHKEKEDRVKSEHKDHKREKRKMDDESLNSASKRPHNGWPSDRPDKDSNYPEEKNDSRKRDRERSNDGSYNRSYDRHASGMRDYPKESRYPQDFNRDGASSSSGGYHREANYPYHSGEGSYSHQNYYRGGKGDFRRSQQHGYPKSSSYSSHSQYQSSRGGGSRINQAHGARPPHSQRPNYNSAYYGTKPSEWNQQNNGRGPPSFQT